MSSFVSSSHLTVFAGGDKVKTDALIPKPKDAHHCAWCGVDLSANVFNGLVAKYKPSVGFNNQLDLAVPNGKYLCPHCLVLSDGQKYMLQAKTAVACQQGIFPLSKDAHLQNFFLNPPEPPFVVVYSTAKQAHLYWRTPMSLSKDLFLMRFNNEVAMVRRKRVLQVIQQAADLLATVNSLLVEQIKLKKPLLSLLSADYREARKKSANDSGQVSTYPAYLARKAENESLALEIEAMLVPLSTSINELNPIEVWWMTVIGKTTTTSDPDFVLEPLYQPIAELKGTSQ